MTEATHIDHGANGNGHAPQPMDAFKQKRDELFRLHASEIYRIRELSTSLDIIWQSVEFEGDTVKFETAIGAACFLADEIGIFADNIERDLRPIANKRYYAEGGSDEHH